MMSKKKIAAAILLATTMNAPCLQATERKPSKKKEKKSYRITKREVGGVILGLAVGYFVFRGKTKTAPFIFGGIKWSESDIKTCINIRNRALTKWVLSSYIHPNDPKGSLNKLIGTVREGGSLKLNPSYTSGKKLFVVDSNIPTDPKYKNEKLKEISGLKTAQEFIEALTPDSLKALEAGYLEYQKG